MFYLFNVYNSSEFFPAHFETVRLHGSTWDLRGFTLFNVDLKCCNCPSARCTSAANAIYKDTGIFNRSILMNDMLDVDIFPPPPPPPAACWWWWGFCVDQNDMVHLILCLIKYCYLILTNVLIVYSSRQGYVYSTYLICTTKAVFFLYISTSSHYHYTSSSNPSC